MARRELLVEIGVEEIPAGWLEPVIRSFAAAIATGLSRAGIESSPVEGEGAPRRLVAWAAETAERQTDRRETILGPPARIGRTPEGAWTRAAIGFARRNGIGREELDAALAVVSTPRGEYVGIERITRGRRAIGVLPGILETALRGVAFPAAMRWDATISGEPFYFGRPIRWIVALHGGEVIPVRIDIEGGGAVRSGNLSRGHRFRAWPGAGAPGAPFAVDSFASLREGLRRRYVLVSLAEREAALGRAIAERVAEVGASVAPVTERLRDLVEWPGAVLGEYPEEFAALPEEIRQTVLVRHQKYLPVVGRCAFVAITNMPDDPSGAIRRGSERVVLARLRDAAFFWSEDRKRPLASRRDALANTLFHQQLGSYAEKADRLARLSEWLAERVGADPKAAARAGALAKCDLTTALVGEFASLQGVAGGLYLRAEGAPAPVWRGVYDHYRPEGLGGELPAGRSGAVVSAADRADTLAGFFLAGESPSGSGDPFGLRRAALSLLRILRDVEAEWPAPAALLEAALAGYSGFSPEARDAAGVALAGFVSERLLHALEDPPRIERGVARAVLAVRGPDRTLAGTRRRIEALAGAAGARAEQFEVLAHAANRIRGILEKADEKAGVGAAGESLRVAALAETAEIGLYRELDRVAPGVREDFACGRFLAGLERLCELAPPVDRFFDEILVMTPDASLRANRLALLARLDALFFEVGDLRELRRAATGSRDAG